MSSNKLAVLLSKVDEGVGVAPVVLATGTCCDCETLIRDLSRVPTIDLIPLHTVLWSQGSELAVGLD